MEENTYESLIRRAYQDFESGDMELLDTVMAPDVVWHEPGRSSLAGDYKGPQAVLDFLRDLKELSGGTFNIEILEVLSQPERQWYSKGKPRRRNRKILDVIGAVDFEIDHSRITEVTVYQADTYQFDEFWGDVVRSR